VHGAVAVVEFYAAAVGTGVDAREVVEEGAVGVVRQLVREAVLVAVVYPARDEQGGVVPRGGVGEVAVRHAVQAGGKEVVQGS